MALNIMIDGYYVNHNLLHLCRVVDCYNHRIDIGIRVFSVYAVASDWECLTWDQ